VTLNVCTCEIQQCCELTVLNRLHQLCSIVLFTHCLQHVCNLLVKVLLYWTCAILVTFSVYLSLFLTFPLYNCSHTHYSPSLQSHILRQKFSLWINELHNCCPVQSQLSPIPF